jgi:aspartate aminotransferase
MGEALKSADVAALAKEAGDPRLRFSAQAEGLRGSEIIRIANEIREILATGRQVCDLTVGDFSPQHFPVPARLAEALRRAIERGETNYPPSTGLPNLRKAVTAWYARALGLDYPVESVLVLSGSRPGIYGTYRVLVDPGDIVAFPVPSWNNNHYTYLVGGVPRAIPCSAGDRFQPSREAVRAAIPGARLLALCSPLNPTGTLVARDTLRGICEDVVGENERRERAGQRPLFLLYDQVYWTLTFGEARHYTPPGLVPEMARYTVLVDGISKAFAATGLRVGWAVGPTDVIFKMMSLMGHLGGWAPRAEQCATIELLEDARAIEDFGVTFRRGIQARLDALSRGFARMKSAGLPVDCLEPSGAMYLTARVAPFGRRVPQGKPITTNDDVRGYLLGAAGVAAVPFQAFGTKEDDGWFRLSVGAVGLGEVEAALPRIETALRALA